MTSLIAVGAYRRVLFRFELSDPSDFKREGGYWFSRALKHSLAKEWIQEPLVFMFRKWQLALIIVATAGMYFVHKVFRRRDINARNAALVLLALAFLLGSQMDAFVDYRPMRYYVPLLFYSTVLAVSVAASTCRWLFAPSEKTLDTNVQGAFLVGNRAFVLKFGLADILAKRDILPEWLTPWRRMALAAAVADVILILLILLRGRLVSVVRGVSPAWRKAAAMVILLPVLLFALDSNQKGIVKYVNSPRYDLYDFSVYLGEEFHDVTIAGTTPLFAVMENDDKAVKVTEYHLNWDAVREKRITHLILPTDFRHDRMFERRLFPEAMKDATLIDRFCP